MTHKLFKWTTLREEDLESFTRSISSAALAPSFVGASAIRLANSRDRLMLCPYAPSIFSSTHSIILLRTSGGKSGAVSIRMTILAEIPDPLWAFVRILHAVVRLLVPARQ